jgi:hypothetical protein
MLKLILLMLITPTLIDISDYNNYQQGVPKYLTEESIPDRGFMQGNLTLANGHHPELGFVDSHDSFYYTDCGEGCAYFVHGWRITAAVTPSHGLAVYQNNTLLFMQDEPYPHFSAQVKIFVKGEHLHFYLDGKNLFSSHHPEIIGKDLKGYYYDDVSSPVIQLVSNLRRPLKNIPAGTAGGRIGVVEACLLRRC